MSKITLEDVQVKEALKDIQQSYQRIAELKTIEDPLLQFIAGETIRFHELRIENTEYALWKKGLSQFNAEKWKKREQMEKRQKK
jgi:hypothetical protein